MTHPLMPSTIVTGSRDLFCPTNPFECNFLGVYTLTILPLSRRIFPSILGVALSLTMATALSAWSQEEELAEPPQEEQSAAEEEEQVVELPGDVILLRSGRRLTGVQITKRTPRYVEVLVLDGVPPIKILRRNIVGIEEDDISPQRERRIREMEAERAESNLISGKRISPELNEKILTVLPNTPRKLQDRDVVQVLKNLTQNLGIQFEVHESVKKLPPAKRNWTYQLKEGVTLATLLQDGLSESFPDLKGDVQFDKIVLMTQAAFEAQESAAATGADAQN